MITEREQAMHDWIEIILMKDLAISSVEDKTFRSFSKHSGNISRKMVTQLILRLNDIVEKKISTELKSAERGSILHDGWSSMSMHYVGRGGPLIFGRF